MHRNTRDEGPPASAQPTAHARSSRSAWLVSRLALLLAVVAAALLPSSGLGTRFGLWSFATGFELLRYAAYAGLAALLIALIALLVPRLRAAQGRWLAAALVLSAGVVAVPAYWMLMARAVPPIHDISTDVDDPPSFVEVAALREDAPNPITYGGAEVAAAQQAAYPHIQPLVLATTRDEAFAIAREAAGEMGWEIVSSDREDGRIEATDTTLWFGFKDDVVIRVRADADGRSRIDVRSKSRVGKSDVGANAARVKTYLDRVAALAGPAQVKRQND